MVAQLGNIISPGAQIMLTHLFIIMDLSIAMGSSKGLKYSYQKLSLPLQYVDYYSGCVLNKSVVVTVNDMFVQISFFVSLSILAGVWSLQSYHD